VRHARHPYTVGLMGAIPKIGAGAGKHHSRLVQIEGAMPRLNAMPSGCAFHPRCGKSFERCVGERPDPRAVGATLAACWLYE
jgi:peptide/nickel transport system ATP-binding protein